MPDRWIRCGVGRMPRRGADAVLARLDDGAMVVAEWAEDSSGWLGWWALTPDTDRRIHGGVTHWMPLPPQPEDTDE